MAEGLRIVVCGGRYYSDRMMVYGVLDDIHRATPIKAVMQGGASGADAWAQGWAIARKLTSLPVPADWTRHGKAAGPIRNKMMVDWRPDMVVAFPGGTGTADMVRQAKAAGIKVLEVEGG